MKIQSYLDRLEEYNIKFIMLTDFLQNMPSLLASCFIISFFAGVVKGVVGFAMPMILLSGLSTLMPPEQALAALILPTLVTNFKQAFTPGPPRVIEILFRYRLFLITCGIFLMVSSQLTPYLPSKFFLGTLGVLICFFSLLQILKFKLSFREKNLKITIGLAMVTGFIGGMSGVWGPLTVTYLTALNLGKEEHVKVQGTVYSLGAILLLFGHIKSGIFTWYTASFSASLIIPSTLGLLFGTIVRSKLDEAKFRKMILVVLLISGSNLVRKAWFL